jgi:hypothetical protein
MTMAGIKVCPNIFCHAAFADDLQRCPACRTFVPDEDAVIHEFKESDKL